MKNFFIYTAGLLVLAFVLLVAGGHHDLEEQRQLVRSLPEKAASISTAVFGTGLSAIELANNFDVEQDFILTPAHLDYPVKLRKFSEQFCALEAKSHCALLFYTDRAALPQSLNDLSDHVHPVALFTINQTIDLKELSYNLEDGGYSDKKGDLQKYFADHGKAWQ